MVGQVPHILHCRRDHSVNPLTNFQIFKFSNFLVSRFRACLPTQSGRVPSREALSCFIPLCGNRSVISNSPTSRFRGSFTYRAVARYSAYSRDRSVISHSLTSRFRACLPTQSGRVLSLEALSCFIPHCGNRSVTINSHNSSWPYCHKYFSLAASELKLYFVLNAF